VGLGPVVRDSIGGVENGGIDNVVGVPQVSIVGVVADDEMKDDEP
jgi:hypothetical protein